MKEKIKSLKRQSLTAEGMFDDQLDWYRDQLTVVNSYVNRSNIGNFFLKIIKFKFLKKWFNYR